MRVFEAPYPNLATYSRAFEWLLVAVLVVTSFAMPARINAQVGSQHSTELDRRVSVSLTLLQRYTSTRSLDDLKASAAAISSAFYIDSLTPHNFIHERRILIAGWAKILKALEDRYDPSFNPIDPSNRPFVCITPPLENSGRQMPSCASPSDLIDQNARTVYERELAENRKIAARANEYHEIELLDESTMGALDMVLDQFRRIAPNGATPDFTGLDGILQQSHLSADRRQRIEGMIYAPTDR